LAGKPGTTAGAIGLAGCARWGDFPGKNNWQDRRISGEWIYRKEVGERGQRKLFVLNNIQEEGGL
jgi:hypothetical protein